MTTLSEQIATAIMEQIELDGAIHKSSLVAVVEKEIAADKQAADGTNHSLGWGITEAMRQAHLQQVAAEMQKKQAAEIEWAKSVHRQLKARRQ